MKTTISELRLLIRSVIAETSDQNSCKERGHNFPDEWTFDQKKAKMVRQCQDCGFKKIVDAFSLEDKPSPYHDYAEQKIVAALEGKTDAGEFRTPLTFARGHDGKDSWRVAGVHPDDKQKIIDIVKTNDGQDVKYHDSDNAVEWHVKQYAAAPAPRRLSDLEAAGYNDPNFRYGLR